MTEEGVKYETKTVRAIRGAESRTVSKWEKEGWEVASQSQGKLHTEIVIRRPRPKAPWRLIAISGGALAVLIITPIVIGALSDSDTPEPLATATTTAPDSAAIPTASDPASQEATPTLQEERSDGVLTRENNEDLAEILELGESCDGSVAAFAEEYRGETITFDGNIADMASHDGASTRYDILLGVGGFSETSMVGPAFQFRDVNTTSDLHYTGDTPDTIGVGTNLRVTARVDEYDPGSCLFLLEPVETAFP